MILDWAIEHASLLYQLGVALVGLFGFAVFVRSEMLSIRSDINQIKESQKLLMDSFQQLNTILTKIAVQDARLNMLEKDIDELRHYKGFIETNG